MRRLLQHWTESSVNPASRKRSVWTKWMPKKRTVSFVEDRSLTWSTSTSGLLEPTILSRISADPFTIGLRNDDIQEFVSKLDEILLSMTKNPIWWHLGRIVQIKNTRVWETQDLSGIVQHGDSPEESRTWLSQIEDNCEKKYRAKFTDEEFWGQKLKLWKERRGQELGWTKNSGRLFAVESQRAVF